MIFLVPKFVDNLPAAWGFAAANVGELIELARSKWVGAGPAER